MIKVTCVVDNAVERGSPMWGEHGLSFRIDTEQGCLLFDTGRSEAVFWHNLGLLGAGLGDVSALVLSHAHYDHTGALLSLLGEKPSLPVHAHPDICEPRFATREGKYKSIGLPLNQAELSQLANLRLSDVPTQVLPGVWTSGEIKGRTEAEGRSPGHVVPGDDPLRWQPDPYLDDMALVMETRQGLVVLCGCCHAGLLNTLAQVRRTFPRPITTVLGGTHLLEADGQHLQRVVEALRDTYGAPRLYLNHCTGERAYVALASAFGERVKPCPAGTALAFD